MAAPTREQIEAELAIIDKKMEQPVQSMYTQTCLESYQAALCWVLGQRDDAPSQLVD